MNTTITYPALVVGMAVLAWCIRHVRFPKTLEVVERIGQYSNSKEELKTLGKRLEALRVPVSAEVFAAGKKVFIILLVLTGGFLLAGGQNWGLLILLSVPMSGKLSDLMLDLREKKRKEAIQGDFPLMVEQVKVYAKAVGYYDALKVVARSWKGVLGRELGLLSAEIELLGVIGAIDNFANRCNVDEIRDFARIITVEHSTGADINDILSNYAKDT
ncbi:MAG: hypothetical protein ACYDEQ_08530, partial [Desulfocucumaceae bacterium]